MKNLHVTLPDEMVARLDRLTAIEESSRAALVREAVQTFLTSKERELEAREMHLYANEMADLSREFVTWSAVEVDAALSGVEW